MRLEQLRTRPVHRAPTGNGVQSFTLSAFGFVVSTTGAMIYRHLP
jgi:hypothetical protein